MNADTLRWLAEWLAAIVLVTLFALFMSGSIGLFLLIWKRILT